jgi:PPOX class probable F420-dependent enzyme
MSASEARERFAAARVARLATIGEDGRPHLVPIVLALDGERIYHAVDSKPKRTTALRRLANIAAHPRVALLADEYDDDDWTRLWWARADGSARVLETDADESRAAIALLQDRYAQYRDAPPNGPVVAIAVERWTGWRAAA